MCRDLRRNVFFHRRWKTLVYQPHLLRHFNHILSDHWGFTTDRASFQHRHLLTPNLEGNIHILRHYRTILEKIGLDDPLIIWNRRKAQPCLEVACLLSTCDLALGEQLHVFGDSLDEEIGRGRWALEGLQAGELGEVAT